MEIFYPFLIAFLLIFFAELGDKTQLLVLSFSTKNKAKSILFGIALGTLFSHGLAILFGSQLGTFNNPVFQFWTKFITYSTFLLFGIFGFLPKNEEINSNEKPSFLSRLSSFKIPCTLLIALCIFIGELGDKTLLASLGLGLEYPNFKLSLLLGCIFGMVCSNILAIFFGKFIQTRLPTSVVQTISNILFLLFGLLGFISLFIFEFI